MQTSSTTHFFLQSVEADSEARRIRWRDRRGTERLLARDAGLFTGRDEDRWLGWLEPKTEVAGLLREYWFEDPKRAVESVDRLLEQ